MMKTVSQLPNGYREIYTVDLQKNKKMALLVNGLATLIGVLLAVPMHFVVPFSTLFDMSAGLAAYFIRFGVLFVSILVYTVLHELVHGAAMKLCGTKRVKYGYTGLYAYAGSEDYYGKAAYIFIALAPVVLWGIVLLVVQFCVPTAWFWVVYIVQITNLSGAAGDYFVTLRFLRLPADILVRDSGVSMCVYSRLEEEQ